MWEEIGLKSAEIAADQIGSAIEYGRTKKLMGIQMQNQMELNRQGQQLQLDTWNKTNYPAQVSMLKSAGLNPGLLYAKGGAGGQTGSQTGGAAASGAAPRATPMEISNLLTMQRTKAETENIQADTAKKNAERGVIEGTGIREAESRINKMIAETTNEELKADLIKIQTAGESIRVANSQEQITAGIQQTVATTNKLLLENKLTQANFDSIVKEQAARAIGATLENELTSSKTKLTDTEKQALVTGLVQKWTQLSQDQQRIVQEGKKIEQKDQDIAIEKFKAEINAEYPSAMNVAGSVMKKAYKSLEGLANAMVMRYDPANWEPDKVK